jgi:hypothetical protein
VVQTGVSKTQAGAAMRLRSKVFQSAARWTDLCNEVTAWVNTHVKSTELVSISMSESGRSLMDTMGTIVVWYWGDDEQ